MCITVILGKSHYILYGLVAAMQPRMLVTFDEELRPLPVSVRVGQVKPGITYLRQLKSAELIDSLFSLTQSTTDKVSNCVQRKMRLPILLTHVINSLLNRFCCLFFSLRVAESKKNFNSSFLQRKFFFLRIEAWWRMVCNLIAKKWTWLFNTIFSDLSTGCGCCGPGR